MHHPYRRSAREAQTDWGPASRGVQLEELAVGLLLLAVGLAGMAIALAGPHVDGTELSLGGILTVFGGATLARRRARFVESVGFEY